MPGPDPVTEMGGRNAQRLRSSISLFLHTSGDSACTTFKAVLDKYFQSTEDDATLSRIYLEGQRMRTVGRDSSSTTDRR